MVINTNETEETVNMCLHFVHIFAILYIIFLITTEQSIKLPDNVQHYIYDFDVLFIVPLLTGFSIPLSIKCKPISSVVYVLLLIFAGHCPTYIIININFSVTINFAGHCPTHEY